VPVDATVTNVFAAIPVMERDEALPYYERLTGRRPDLIPNDQEACWRVTETAWIYILTDAAVAGSARVTLLVDDLQGLLGELAGRGIESGPPQTVTEGTRAVLLRDPDGNQIQFGEVAAPG